MRCIQQEKTRSFNCQEGLTFLSSCRLLLLRTDFINSQQMDTETCAQDLGHEIPGCYEETRGCPSVHTLSMSHITTFLTLRCFKASLAVDPSPPPIMKTLFGLQTLSSISIIRHQRLNVGAQTLSAFPQVRGCSAQKTVLILPTTYVETVSWNPETALKSHTRTKC